MRACTAVIIELAHHPAPGYAGTVEFISKSDWESELEDMLGDLTQQDGRAILHVQDPNAHNYESWCKLYAVYGETYTHSSERTGAVGPGGRATYAGPMIADLKAKLLRCQTITGQLGSSVAVTGAHRKQDLGCTHTHTHTLSLSLSLVRRRQRLSVLHSLTQRLPPNVRMAVCLPACLPAWCRCGPRTLPQEARAFHGQQQ
eukprot:SAG22_NODE_1412_length_4477_cov_8.593878_5_plen_201_part_00